MKHRKGSPNGLLFRFRGNFRNRIKTTYLLENQCVWGKQGETRGNEKNAKFPQKKRVSAMILYVKGK